MKRRTRPTWRGAWALTGSLALLAGCGGTGAPPATKTTTSQAQPGIRWDSNQPPDLPGLAGSKTGSLAFSVDTKDEPGLKTRSLPSATAKVSLQLSSDALATPYSVDILPNQFANGAVLFTVYSLPEGQYTVSANVLNSSNTSLAAGSTVTTVIAGTTTPVTLVLTADSSSTTGAVKVSIDTTSSANAGAALILPSTGKVLQAINLAAGSRPAALTFDSEGNLWVANYGANQVQKIDVSSATPAITTPVPAILSPLGITADTSTPHSRIWVSYKIAPSSPFPTPSPTSNTAALWHFDESSGSTAADSSGNGNTATVNSGVNPVPSWGPRSYSRYFPGTANSMRVTNHTTLNPTGAFSFETWIKPEDVSSANRTIFRQAGTHPKYLRFVQSGGSSLLSFGLSIGGTLETCDATITPSQWVDDNWHYVAATYDGSDMKLYKDGNTTPICTTSVSGSIDSGDDDYQIGSWDGWIEGFKGSIDETRIYRAARSSSDIHTYWTANADPDNQGNLLVIDTNGTQYTMNPSQYARPTGISVGPNGTLWAANTGAFTAGSGGGGTSITNLDDSNTWDVNYIETVPAGPWGMKVIDQVISGSHYDVAWVGTTAGVTKLVPATSRTDYSFPSTAQHLRGGLAINPAHNTIWTANDYTHNVSKMTTGGTIVGHYAVGNPTTSEPLGIVVDDYNSVWITDRTGDAVYRLDSNGVLLGSYPLPAGTHPWGIALDAKGNPWIAGYGNDTIIKLGR